MFIRLFPPLQDACQGDSGGPYFVLDGGDDCGLFGCNSPQGFAEATAIGLVSRGVGCGELNSPGKATR